MNFRKGFVRLWSFFSICWIASILISSWSSLNIDRALRHWKGSGAGQTAWSFVDISNPDAAIILIGDRKLRLSRDSTRKPFMNLDRYAQQVAVEEIANELQISYSQIASLDAAAAGNIQSQFGLAFLPPIIVLVLGASLGWVAAGFVQKK
jgi:hypothetical protein